MSKQEQSMIILLENMQKALDKSNRIIEEQAAHIKLQDQKIDYLTRQLFSQKSEKFPDGQLSLFADEEETILTISINNGAFCVKKPTSNIFNLFILIKIILTKFYCVTTYQKLLIKYLYFLIKSLFLIFMVTCEKFV